MSVVRPHQSGGCERGEGGPKDTGGVLQQGVQGDCAVVAQRLHAFVQCGDVYAKVVAQIAKLSRECVHSVSAEWAVCGRVSVVYVGVGSADIAGEQVQQSLKIHVFQILCFLPCRLLKRLHRATAAAAFGRPVFRATSSPSERDWECSCSTTFVPASIWRAASIRHAPLC